MRTIVLSIFMFTTVVLQAQQDSSYMLPVVDVIDQLSAQYLKYGGNYSSDSLETHFQPTNSLGELPVLQQQGYRNYGPGRLTSLALRGTGAQQTALFWEGVPVNNPMIGIADLSIFMMDPSMGLTITQGLWATHQGMGSAAGAVSMNEDYSNSDGLQPYAEFRVSSYENYFGTIHLATGSSRYHNNFSASYQSGKNNYPHRYFADERKLPNAGQELWNGKWTGKLQLSSTNSLSFGSWYTTYDRQIPPTRLQASSDAVESGAFWRNFLRHQWVNRKFVLRSTFSYQDERFSYKNPTISLDQTNRVQNWFAQQKISGGNARWQWIGGWELQHLTPNSPSYTDSENAIRGAVFMRSKWQMSRNELIFKLRQDFSDQRFGIPVVTSLITGQFSPSIGYFAGAGTLFRWPSLDDLYWTPGGDMELDPEYGWNTEVGFQWEAEDLDFHKINISGTVFLRMHYDAIQWYPDGALWSVGNRGTLRTSGVILQADWKYRNRGWFTQARANVQYVDSDRIDNNDGIQEIYVPRFSGTFQAIAGKGKWALYSDQSFRSQRNYLNDKNSVLPAVFLANLAVSYEMDVVERSLQIQLGCRNVSDTDHEWIINRPMPGRTYYLSLKLF